MSDTISEKGRGEIEDLLPWYANGRLTPGERRRVEAALTGDAELARRLDLVREEMAETIAANEALPAPSSRAFDRLMAEIDAEPVRARPLAAIKAGLIDRLAGLLDGLAPRRLAWGALAVVAIVVVQTVMLGGLLSEKSGGGYGTASTGMVVPQGPTLLVAFAPDAKIGEITALLKTTGASVVEAPKTNGYWRLRPGEGVDPAQLAAKLKAETRLIGFVQLVP